MWKGEEGRRRRRSSPLSSFPFFVSGPPPSIVLPQLLAFDMTTVSSVISLSCLLRSFSLRISRGSGPSASSTPIASSKVLALGLSCFSSWRSQIKLASELSEVPRWISSKLQLLASTKPSPSRRPSRLKSCSARGRRRR